ncbi:MAG: hypothetical protein EOO60_12980 [Hymenobacter sp.]|nr:MAG: hypothetical protein EOO60_12980 [Hymenobacter sp.]
MREVIAVETVAETFTLLLNQALQAPAAQQVATVLHTLVAFYQTTAIAEVDLIEEEADALLFEYGTYNLHDGRGEHFTLGFTRQFQLAGDEEYYQLRCELVFAGNFAPELPGVTSWSWDYPTLAAWQAAVQQTLGYRKAQTTTAHRMEISLDQT